MVETEYESVPIEDKVKQREDVPLTYGFGVRHVQSMLIFMCLTLGYAARGHLGVTIVAMTTSDSHNSKHMFNKEVNNITNMINKTEGIKNTGLLNYSNENLTIQETILTGVYRTFDWNKSTQEMIFGSFFLGYSIMLFPMGLVSQRWGAKIPIQIAMIVNGVLSFFTPWIVVWGGWKVLCGIRLLQGLSQAGIFPAISILVSNWVPISERATFSSFIYTGSGVGTIIAFQLGGILGFSKFGWPSTFWVTGVVCIIGFVIVTFFGAATPMEHNSISEAEKIFIMGTNKEEEDVKIKSKLPWKPIFISIRVWSTFITHIGTTVCFVYVFTQVPSYMYWVLKLDIRNSGIFSSLPYLAAIFSSVAFGVFSDYFTNRKIITLRQARILCNSVACVIPSICLTLVSYTTNVTLATACLIICIAAHAGVHSGCLVNYVDLSPNYSGALMASANAMANFAVLGLPIIISYIVTDVTNQSQWRITMFLVAGLILGSNIIFMLFMSSDAQAWNSSERISNTDNITDKEPEVINLVSKKKLDNIQEANAK